MRTGLTFADAFRAMDELGRMRERLVSKAEALTEQMAMTFAEASREGCPQDVAETLRAAMLAAVDIERAVKNSEDLWTVRMAALTAAEEIGKLASMEKAASKG